MSNPAGYELPLRLLFAFRSIIDELHSELAREGHEHSRPLHGFVLQAIGPDGVSATELGRRLGVTKQAAAKHIETLERLGYAARTADPNDARSRRVQITDKGYDMLSRSAAIFGRIRARWADQLGAERLSALEADLRAMTANRAFALDLPGWFGAG